MQYQVIPVIRIFDEEKARAFYLEYLGMEIDWEHRFDDDLPIYMQVSKGGLVLHLSEHSGDCSPGSKTFINVDDIETLFNDMTSRPYRYNCPSLEDAPWGDLSFTLVDPFSNKIVFNQLRSKK